MGEGEKVDAPPVPWMHGAAGITSGALSMTLFYPLDFLRTRLHTYDGTNKGALRGVQQIIREEGFRGMYRGVKVAVGSHSVGWGMYLTFFRTAQGNIAAVRGRQSSLGDFLAACIAATFTSVAVTPLNLLKTRTQLHDSQKRPPKGIFRGLKFIIQSEGWRSLFRGVGPQLLLSSHTTIQVALYECIKREVFDQQDLTIVGVAVASAVSKSVASAFCNPLEVCRTRLQDKANLGKVGYTSMKNGFSTIWRNEGVRGLYRGLGMNICRVVPTTVIAFILYEKFLEGIHYMHKRSHATT